MKFQIPKGLFDILPYNAAENWRLSEYWQHVEAVMRKIARDYAFQEIRTPVFEKAELFDRGVGEATDIVSKEMYVFEDKAKRSLALRPEGTSSVMRAFVEKNLYTYSKINKLFYIAPMFRYERPQAGRYRQHHQFGVEAIGNASFEQDVEIIDMLWELYKRLGLKNLTLQLNSIGDAGCRESFKKVLSEFLTPHYDSLSEESKVRFEKNILRIFDSKDPKDQEILQNAPSILDYLSDDAKKHFDGVCHLLEKINIPFEINPKIVRGLDYYNRTVFEITTEELGAQGTIGAGGRYDGFTSVFGGPSLPGIGFGCGIERVLQVMLRQNVSFPKLSNPFVYFIALGDRANEFCFTLLTKLRHAHLPCEMSFNTKKVQEGLKKANQLMAQYAVVIGDDEIASNQVSLKHMIDRKENKLALANLFQTLLHLWSKNEHPTVQTHT
ncbi:MAG: histidine--tRNA ligase [Chlamydiae bacterium CG10_big_fil_rev_8_21_14_0_10_35_9]|nr:MAG: histidine--tRNA ligase [Chlamydiae bacterium CG10_big_fil_rev_8_21_14_0_10_35_9]